MDDVDCGRDCDCDDARQDLAQEQGTGDDRLAWGIILGGGFGASAWILFDVWWLAGLGMIAGIAAASWVGLADDR